MSDPAAITADAYRAVMRHWPSGVTILTMLDGDRAHGMTASAFTSVSVDPPLVLVVIDKRWRSHDYVQNCGVFCVNILSSGQQRWSDRFAGRHGEMDDRFYDVPTETAVTGAPCLTEALGYLDCVVEASHDAGDHTIFVGRVVAGVAREGRGEPLVYHHTRYARLEPLEGSDSED